MRVCFSRRWKNTRSCSYVTFRTLLANQKKRRRITHILRFGTVQKHFRCIAIPKKCPHFYELMLKLDRVHSLKSFDASVVAALIHANASMVSKIIKYGPQTDEVISSSFDESKCGSLATLCFLHSPIYCPRWCYLHNDISQCQC